jgi:hypothetical protein
VANKEGNTTQNLNEMLFDYPDHRRNDIKLLTDIFADL